MGHTAIPKRACKRPSGLTSQMLKGMFGGSQELEAFRSRKIEVSCECFRHGFCLKLGKPVGLLEVMSAQDATVNGAPLNGPSSSGGYGATDVRASAGLETSDLQRRRRLRLQ